MSDGVNFDREHLERLDRYVRSYADSGVRALMRLTTGGHTPGGEFRGIPNVRNWPVDTTNYFLPPHDGYKNGEWLGEIDGSPRSYPPRTLTRDEPGNTSPWYDFVYAVATRYNGATPDPKRPGAYLPAVHYWAIAGENELKYYWYGTATELYGGIDGDPRVGVLPTLYRAVHAANPRARVVGGSLTDGTALVCILYAEMLRTGGYDEEMLAYGNDWMRQMVPLQFANLQNLKNRMKSPKYVRIRGFMDALLAANPYYDVLGYHMYSAYDYVDDLVRFYRQSMAQHGFEKPLWGTETGIFNFPLGSQEEHAQDVVKLLTVSLSEGVQHVTYSGMIALYSYQGFLYAGLYDELLVPYRMLNPNAPPERYNDLFGRVAQESFSFFTHTMKRKRYRFDRTIEKGSTILYIFDSTTDGSRLCVAWSEGDGETFDPRPELGAPAGARLDLFDYRGRPQRASTGIRFTPAPVFLEWVG
jgi:hypothetical protein